MKGILWKNEGVNDFVNTDYSKYLDNSQTNLELINVVEKIIKVVKLPIIPYKSYMQTNKNSYILIVLHWTKLISKADQHRDALYELAFQYPKEKFIIRLHPLFRRQTNNDGWHIDKEVSERFITKLSNIPNVVFNELDSLSDIMQHSKMLIIDGVTLISDYLITRKPILMLNNESEPVENYYNSFFQKLIAAIYNILTPNQLCEVFKSIIVDGKDDKKQARKRIYEQLFSKKIDKNLVKLFVTNKSKIF